MFFAEYLHALRIVHGCDLFNGEYFKKKKNGAEDQPMSLFAFSLPALFETQWVSLVATEEEDPFLFCF